GEGAGRVVPPLPLTPTFGGGGGTRDKLGGLDDGAKIGEMGAAPTPPKLAGTGEIGGAIPAPPKLAGTGDEARLTSGLKPSNAPAIVASSKPRLLTNGRLSLTRAGAFPCFA